MRSATRKAATIGATLALAMSGALLAAAPASAATSCYASSCTGLDPAATTCAGDAITVSQNGPLELRYSPSCRAIWGRDVAGIPGDFLEVYSDAGGRQTATWYSTGRFWTPMLNDKDVKSRAHLKSSNEEDWTDWY
ncbi:DUF2690 domain-containing protein [Kitasatospora sp. NPDC101157]|uniref:DUF2690 domain-containing protein n=1 Tax=Kitasatospora sp. NPDC101157 TaxID=3364098 RepID=UPI00381BD991